MLSITSKCNSSFWIKFQIEKKNDVKDIIETFREIGISPRYMLVVQWTELSFHLCLIQFSSVQSLSRVRLFATPWSQHTRPPCPSQTPGFYSNSCPLSRWCHPAISSSVISFSSCAQPLPASGSFPMSQLFAWGGQSTGVSASSSVLPMNIQDWSPPGWTCWISLQSKGLSRVFSNTIVQKHQFFGAHGVDINVEYTLGLILA